MGVRKQIKLRPAVFLDRDGVIIRQEELLVDLKKVRLLTSAAESIRRFKHLGYVVVVVSNQPVVARGLITEEGVGRMNKAIAARLLQKGARIDAFYFCPHHPNATLRKYRKKCSCRKPAPGMILRAAGEMRINPEESFMIGDALIDVAAGKRAGLKTILVKTGPGHSHLDKLQTAKPDFVARDLAVAASIIAKHTSQMGKVRKA